MLFKIILWISFHLRFTTLAHYDPAYFRSSNDPFHKYEDWMKDIPDEMWLSELALPGTHDSATFTTNYAIVTTQALNFREQLEYGIRVLDIRFRHTNDRFSLHHGPIFLNVMFEDFLDIVDEFLHEHPSEVVLFRIAKEQADKNDNTRTMEETLQYYLSTYSKIYKQTTENVKLGEARGKFIMISYEREFNPYGFSKELFDIQDKYELKNIWQLYNKWLVIRSHLEKSAQGEKSQFFTNYLSGSGGVPPYFVVSGHTLSGTSAPRLLTGLTTPIFQNSYPDFPRVDCIIGFCSIVFEGTNILSRDWIRSHTCSNRTVGIVISDFPGTSLIEVIIQNNFRFDSCDKK